ncbi:hypothetical protein DN824_11600 [Stutzerimonas nosocomialis]|uniref:Uncharacterized protein n=2 Tax=Stutzerimonas nosocomialis TaxID=1056496 RepID=A0A5R9QHE0_9GAMM|nr:hypothetical protein DN824_11600 [Stutzerimonas nosocomialis]TLX59248.1 hypothetical protein DN826_00160 [Stutzerimonas nosocomialis]TLX64646.1 hypothetical protein DN820_04270 [Stutzerimonas nosocomialis]
MTMSLSEQVPSLTSRIANLAQRLKLTGKTPRLVLERASRLQFAFEPLPEPQPNIFWHEGPPLQHLVDLPRGALSGPVQEDKARAHLALTKLVTKVSEFHPQFDLRQIDGLSGQPLDGRTYPTFEAFAATPVCRKVRIISYRDFTRALSHALPRFEQKETIQLRQASWLGERIYWAGEQHAATFAAAIAYARRRGLDTALPAELTDYRLDLAGVQALQAAYHVLAMPASAWDDPVFVGLLLDGQVPYARLTLLRNTSNSELLLLEKGHVTANALGEGLKLAGSPDAITYLKSLPQITRFRRGSPL